MNTRRPPTERQRSIYYSVVTCNKTMIHVANALGISTKTVRAALDKCDEYDRAERAKHSPTQLDRIKSEARRHGFGDAMASRVYRDSLTLRTRRLIGTDDYDDGWREGRKVRTGSYD